MEGQFCTNCGAPAQAGTTGGGQPAVPVANAPVSGAPPAPAARKTSPVVWILAGCFGLVVIVGIVVTAGGFLFVHKVKQVVDVDKGKITLPGKNGEKVEIQVKGEGESGSLEIKTNQGTARFGAGSAASLPSWLPQYPGATPEGAFSSQGEQGKGGAYGIKTSDPVERVADFYEQGFKAAGLKTTRNTIGQNGQPALITVTGTTDDHKREAHAMISPKDGGTQAAITYKDE
jgi:hypothetical protein